MKTKLKILFVCPQLISGGAERNIVNILNHIDCNKFEPVLVLFKGDGALLKELTPHIRIINLKISRTFFSIPKLVRCIKSEQPDVIFSILRFVCAATVIASKIARTGAPVVVNETNNFSAAGISTKGFRERVVTWAYKRASLILAPSEGIRQDILKRYAISSDLVRTIYNPIDIQKIRALSQIPLLDNGILSDTDRSSVFRIIGVGHFKYQKGFDLLIRAIKILKHLPLQLVLVGDRFEEEILKKLVVDLELTDKVKFAGYQSNPYNWMANADLFVLSSRWEGFGNVIPEAMVCGTPVLSTRCPSGPEEIIENNISGKLCETESSGALAREIQSLINDNSTRMNYAKMALSKVTRFDVTEITKQFENVFIKLAE